MWYDSLMPNELPKADIEVAEAAVIFAQQVRKMHRRRTARNSERRAKDVEMALDRIRDAMSPLKSHIGAFPYGPQTTIGERNRQAVREASAALQRERRKLWKMRPTPEES